MENFDRWPLLSRIDTPRDLKKLTYKELKSLTDEVREYLAFRVLENGGHLASNLGVVELTTAIHRVFDLPSDHLIFDVGHQSYVHKLFTGRKQELDTLRKPGGISGFTKRAESEYDAFGAGHSSTAISAALGMAQADALAGRDCYTVAVVGDGALTGGLAYEGLNNCRHDLRLILVINENEMSISENTGRFAEYLSRVRTSPSYIKTKAFAKSALRHIPLLGKPLHRLFGAIKRKIKRSLYRQNFFEHMCAHYLGPMDGNDLDGMIAALKYAKKLSGSVILHVKTKKGKGYAPAEEDPNRYHSVPPRGKEITALTFSQKMGEQLCALGQKDERICAITAAMADGTGLAPFAKDFPDRFFDVGIAEGHALTFAAGLAAGGIRPVVALYSSFLQRAYDNLLHDAALQRLPVTLCIDRAGLSAGDGATHHGIYDVAMLSSIAGVRLFAPVSAEGVALSLREALASDGVCALRYPAGAPDERLLAAFYPDGPAEHIGVRAWQNREGLCEAFVVTHGASAAIALRAAEILRTSGITVRVLLCEYITPYACLAEDVAALLGKGSVVFYEAEIKSGGFAMNLRDTMLQRGLLAGNRSEILAIEDGFFNTVMGQSVYHAAGVDAETLADLVKKLQNEKEREL